MSDLLEIRMPADQSEGTRSQVLRWLKAEGESVTQDEPLIEMETDKVTVEIAAPHAGVLRQILKPEQSDVEPGEVLGLIEGIASATKNTSINATSAADAAPLASTSSTSSLSNEASDGDAVTALSPAVRRLLSEKGLSASDIAGTGRGGRITVDDVLSHGTRGSDGQRSAVNTDAPNAVTDSRSGAQLGSRSQEHLGTRLYEHAGTDAPSTASAAAQPISSTERTNLLEPASAGKLPSSRKLTSPGERPTSREPASPGERPNACESAPMAERPNLHGDTSSAERTNSREPTPGTRRVPHTAVRKRVAEHMVRSLMQTAPHVTSVFEADMSAVIAHRAANREEYERAGSPLTFTAYFLTAIVDAIRAVPEANSRWTDDALEIYDHINIGVGTALGDQGLVVPVIRNVESLTLQQIAQRLHDVVSRARTGELTPDDVRGGTFTISNHGVSGSLMATPIIINQPQSAILGIGKLDQRVVPAKAGNAERFAVVPKCYVTLTIDHRVMDGFQANRFLQTFVGKLENWQ